MGIAAVRELAAMQTIRITNVPVLFTCSTELRQPLLWQCRCWAQFCQTMNVKIKDLKQIVKLSKKTISELRRLNPERAYNGKELTKYQLIFQIVFLRDSPKEV